MAAATVATCHADGLLASVECYLPPVVGVAHHDVFAVGGPSGNAIRGCRCRLVVCLVVYGIGNVGRHIAYSSAIGVELVPVPFVRIVHHHPSSRRRPLGLFSIFLANQPALACMNVDGIYIERNFLPPFLLLKIRGFVGVYKVIDIAQLAIRH